MKKCSFLKKVLLSILIFTLVFGMCACGGGSDEGEGEGAANADGFYEKPEVTLRLATTTMKTMPACAAAEWFCNEIYDRTKGRIKIEFYPERQLGETNDLVPLLVDGSLDMAALDISFLSMFTNTLDVLQTPFLLTDYEKEAKAFKSPEARALFDKTGEEAGMQILSAGEYGMRYLANNIRPINSTADMEGIKFRVVPSEMILDAIGSCGGNPVALAYGEIYTALQSGVIDGEEINYTSVYSEGHYEVIKYFSNVALWPFPSVIVMSDAAWAALSAEDQELFMTVANEATDYNMTLLDEYTERAKETMIEAGVEINDVADPESFQKATAHIKENLKQKDELTKAFIEYCESL